MGVKRKISGLIKILRTAEGRERKRPGSSGGYGRASDDSTWRVMQSETI